MRKIVDSYGQNRYIPTSGLFSISCIIYLTNEDYRKELRDFIKNKEYRSGVMTSARIQPFC